jgi:CDP-diacylglycerol--glycerol-3-phosphate 3-phosphatidyltransferase
MNVIPQSVKDGFVRLIGPVARALIRAGVHPNTITTIGTLVIVASGVAFGLGRVQLAGFLLLFSGLFDILDGQVARQGGKTTTFGAFYDSTLDRVGESAIFTGLAIHFLRGGVPSERVVAAVLAAIVALAASMLVSYTRARAEGLGIECKVGFAARAERLIVLGLPAMVFGAGPEGALLYWIVVILALATVVTVVQRVVHVARVSATVSSGSRRRETVPTRMPVTGKGAER